MTSKIGTNSYCLYFLVLLFAEKITSVSACGCSCYPIDCQDVKSNGHSSGVYRVYPAHGYTGFDVYCDMDTDGGGWLVLQRRFDGSVDFNRSWNQYLKGFGDVSGEHWLGNQRIHLITVQASYELRVELSDWEGNTAYAKYEVFRVGDLMDNYTLAVSGFSGDARNGLWSHHGMQFTTNDRDNDHWEDGNCAADKASGGWWFKRCWQANLNGIYYPSSDTGGNYSGIGWKWWTGEFYSLKTTEMKIRRVY